MKERLDPQTYVDSGSLVRQTISRARQEPQMIGLNSLLSQSYYYGARSLYERACTYGQAHERERLPVFLGLYRTFSYLSLQELARVFSSIENGQ